MTVTLRGNTYGIAIIVTSCILVPIDIIAITLRIWARGLKGQKLHVNDYLAVGALLCTMAMVAYHSFVVIEFGFGQHASIAGKHNVAQIAKSMLILKPLWAFANTFIKLSVLHLYIHLFTRKWVRIAAYALMVVSGLYCITATLEIFLVCRPLAYFWNPLIRGGSCIDIMKSWFAVGLTNVLIDVLILALPLPVLWSLKMSTRRKFELSAIFSLGIFIIIISALRIKTLLEFDPMNLSGSTGAIGLWSDLEPLLGILNCCLPVLQPIVAKFTRQKVWSKAGSKYSKRSNRGASSGRRSTRRTTTGKQSTQKSDYTRFPTDIFPPAPAYTVDYAQWSQDRSVSTTESYDFDIEAWKQRSSGIVVREEWDVSRSNSG